MCGIVGYIGRHQAAPFLIDGLSKLEYRGYDSSGIAVYHDGKIDVEKCVGRLDALRQNSSAMNRKEWSALAIRAGPLTETVRRQCPSPYG